MDFDNMTEAEIDAALLQHVREAEGGQIEKLASQSGRMIKRRIKESGFQRLILPFEPVGNRITLQLTTDLPATIEWMEPLSPGAKSIPFSDTPDTAFYRGDKFLVIFCKITTPMFTKNIDELHTDGMNLRQVITDNALRDIHTEEDTRFIALVDRIIGVEGTLGEAGWVQNKTVAGPITRPTYNDITSDLEDHDLDNGTFLVNRRTGKFVNGFDAIEAGDEIASKTLTGGAKSLGKFEFFNVPHVATLKRGLVPNNVVYQFGDPAYMGRAYTLQDIRMHVEKKLDILRFCAQEKVGVTIANVGACHRRRFGA